jgi:hypothetical protein
MTMMPWLKLAKIVNQEEQYGRTHLLQKIKMKKVAKQPQESSIAM